MNKWICLLLLCLAAPAAAQPCRGTARESVVVLFQARTFQPGDSLFALAMPNDRCVAQEVYQGGRYLVLAVWNMGVPVKFALHRDGIEYTISDSAGRTLFRPRLNRSHYRIRPILITPKQGE